MPAMRAAVATVAAWLDRPAGRWVSPAITVALLAAPAWLMADSLRNFALFGDDFNYIAEARTWPVLTAHLLEPHNTHVVPLFRLWTFLLVSIAGRLANLPAVFGAASYLALVVAMAAVREFVLRETRRPVLALVAMAGSGLTTVIAPAVTWYSAGQALCAGAAIIGTLLAAQAWRERGGAGRLALVVLGLGAAPAFWSGGLAAGPAAAAYLWADGQPRCRRAALGLLAAMAASVVIVLGLARRQIDAPAIVREHHSELWPRPIQAVLHTAQALNECIILNNLGLDAITTDVQGLVLTLALTLLWVRSRGGRAGINPLEAAGAVILLFSFLMVYFFRGNLPYSSLRSLGWYDVIPHLGAVLFGGGWSVALLSLERPSSPVCLKRKGALIAICLAATLALMQAGRAERMFLGGAPKLAQSEVKRFAGSSQLHARAFYFAREHQRRQIRMLARLDQVERIAAPEGIGRELIRRTFSRVLVPGNPEQQRSTDAASLLSLPDGEPDRDPARVRAALADLYRPEPEPRPYWLEADDIWPTD